MSRGQTVWEIRRSQWAKFKLNEPWAVQMCYSGEFPKLKVLTLGEVLDLAEGQKLGAATSVSMTGQISDWMKTLGLASIYALKEAMLSLNQDQGLKEGTP